MKKLPENRVRAIRKQRGLTLEELGSVINLDWQNIQKIETGKKNLTHSYMLLLAEGLEVEPYELIKDRLEILSNLEKSVQQHIAMIRAYNSLSAEDRQIVDRFLFAMKAADKLARRRTMVVAEPHISDG